MRRVIQSRFDAVDDEHNFESVVSYLDAVGNLSGFKTMRDRMLNWLCGAFPTRNIDIGCGTGSYASEWAKRLTAGAHVIGYDSSQRLVELARIRHANQRNLSFDRIDAAEIPQAEGSVDAVSIERTLMHIGNPLKLMLELRRVMRPGGYLAICEPDFSRLSIEHTDRETTKLMVHHYCRAIKHAAVGSRAVGLLQDAGFVEVREEVIEWQAQLPETEIVLRTSRMVAIAISAGVETNIAQTWRRTLLTGAGRASVPYHLVQARR